MIVLTLVEFREKVFEVLLAQSMLDDVYEADDQAARSADEIVRMACEIDDWHYPILPEKPEKEAKGSNALHGWFEAIKRM